MRKLGIPSALAAIALLAGAGESDLPSQAGSGEGTLRKGQTRREEKPQWLQERLIKRAAEKRARKAARRLWEASRARKS